MDRRYSDGQCSDGQDAAYLRAAATFGPALIRLARAYEADADLRGDLLQDIHFALWRSFAGFAGQCSLRTWVYRVAHNVVISTRLRRPHRGRLVSLDDLAEMAGPDDIERHSGHAQSVARLRALIGGLKPPDAQVMLLYLEDMDAAAIGDITGLSPGAVAARIHRAKALLARDFARAQAGAQTHD